MREINTGPRKRIILNPGEYYITNKNVILQTLLGSCVSACLYDPVKRIIGMNHFLLTNRRYAKNMPVCITEAGRYGIHSMELLINEMMMLGANRKNLKAKAFGAGNVLNYESTHDNFFCVGEVNRKFILEFLELEGIPLISSDLGGEKGRIIYFSSGDYAVHVKKIQRLFTAEVAQKERRYWRTSVERQEKEKKTAELWE